MKNEEGSKIRQQIKQTNDADAAKQLAERQASIKQNLADIASLKPDDVVAMLVLLVVKDPADPNKLQARQQIVGTAPEVNQMVTMTVTAALQTAAIQTAQPGA